MKTRTIEKLTLSTADAAFAQSLYRAFSLDGCVKVGDKIYKVESIGSSHGGVLGPTTTVDAVLVPYAEEVYATEPEPTGPTIADLIGQGYLMSYNWPRSPYPGRGLNFPCTPEPVEPAQWDGEGLPPVGVDFEVLWSSTCKTYVTAKAVGHEDDGRVVYRITSGERAGEYQAERPHTYESDTLPNFRPIKTPEQLAAEQREAAVQRAGRVIADKLSISGDTVQRMAEALYDADMRFPEEK